VILVAVGAGRIVDLGSVQVVSRYVGLAGLGLGAALASGGTLSPRVLVANIRALRDRAPGDGAEGDGLLLAPWWRASALVVTFVAATAAATVWQLPDTYPVSSFPMYSRVAAGDVSFDRVYILDVTRARRTRELRRPVSQLELQRLVSSGDEDGLRTIAESIAAARPRVENVAFVLETSRVTPHPGAVGIEVLSSVEVVRFDLRDDP
jgi:hypothetical protein